METGAYVSSQGDPAKKGGGGRGRGQTQARTVWLQNPLPGAVLRCLALPAPPFKPLSSPRPGHSLLVMQPAAASSHSPGQAWMVLISERKKREGKCVSWLSQPGPAAKQIKRGEGGGGGWNVPGCLSPTWGTEAWERRGFVEIPPRIVTRRRKCLGDELSISALGSQARFPLLKLVCGKPKGLLQVLKVGGSRSPPPLPARGEGGRGSGEPDKTAPESVPPLFPSTARRMAPSRGERTENIFPGLLVFVSGTISASRLEQ